MPTRRPRRRGPAPGIIATEDERYNATLVRRDDQHESLAYFWVRFDEEPTPFEPGQYMTIGVFVDGKIVQRPYSVASAPGVAGDDRLRVLPAARPGRHVHAGPVGPAGRPPDADDRPEGQVPARARRRPDAPVHLVRDRQRAVRLDDARHARGGPAAAGRLPQWRVARSRPRLSRHRRAAGPTPASTR